MDPSAEVEPWLADTIEWSADYTSLTLTAKDGVTWSDGEPFTVEDIAFTFQQFIDFPELDAAAIGLDSVAVEGDAVTLSFQAPMYVKQDKVLHKLIVPKHIWEGVADPTAEVNLDPVGTGPYSLTQFTSQSVQARRPR
ncbi:ABC transporter substrate-binding protein [Demequina litorisediminis]|uniref:Solute-binding protein family 5 domain-containing protein n=1 Tax=Demequina litorisediminis TaxID=1849022 RepID=A0ABQ6IF52_9MICO|nr:ABC transporter substrate-binding protein [Demequina litorisediminis]GMA36440.1 hypothetical protein GCM10025876_26440 [Demequina litorisediminis]